MAGFGCVGGISCAFSRLLPEWDVRARTLHHMMRFIRPGLVPAILLAAGVAAATTVNYEYDELGRLMRAERLGVSASIYVYDAAGNRTEAIVAVTPGAPASINVPATSTGSHTISWTAGSGAATEFLLYQSSNTNFSGQILVYSGATTSKAVSVQNDGTYYYRVRACSYGLCSDYRSGANGVDVTLPPGPPTFISIPSSSTSGSFTISWGASSTGAATSYKLYESTSSDFSGQTLVHDAAGTSKALSGRGNGTYYYRVMACNASGCSAYRAGGNALSVTLPPSSPASISVPSTSTTGSYTISWGSASGTVTAYELYEATDATFSGQVLVHNDSTMSTLLSGRGNGTYYYRVRACNGPACSGYRTGGNATAVTLPPSVPASISVPSTNNTGSYTVSWGSSTGKVTAYKLYEATTSSFSGQALVYSGTSRSKVISGKTDGAYYYRVRACNGSACSGYRTGANPTSVTLPPAAPASISGPVQTYSDYSISWSSSERATRYELWESFSGGAFSKVYDGSNTLKNFSSKSGGEYTYKAKACNAGGCSGFSGTHRVRVCNPICLD